LVGAIHYLSAFAELEVTDLDASLRWYSTVLGFRPIANVGSDAMHLRRAEGQDLVLVEQTSAPERAPGGLILNLALDGGLEAVAAGARKVGIEPDYLPERPDSRPAALELRDPDGYRLRVFARQIPVA
jgi:catechol 2,3-dioxygenase-like lactoylglutathione lyase family enzyme